MRKGREILGLAPLSCCFGHGLNRWRGCYNGRGVDVADEGSHAQRRGAARRARRVGLMARSLI